MIRRRITIRLLFGEKQLSFQKKLIKLSQEQKPSSWKNNSHHWKTPLERKKKKSSERKISITGKNRLSREKNTQPSQGKKKSKSLSKWKNIDPLKKKKTPSQQGKRSLIPEEKKKHNSITRTGISTHSREKKLSLIQKKNRPAQEKRKETQLSLQKALSWENQAQHPQDKKNLTTLWREK